MDEVIQLANAARTNFNGEESHIARFWSDDRVGLTFSPPTRFVAIANQVFKNKNTNLEKTVVTMAKLGLQFMMQEFVHGRPNFIIISNVRLV
jgi:hypothetical protein